MLPDSDLCNGWLLSKFIRRVGSDTASAERSPLSSSTISRARVASTNKPSNIIDCAWPGWSCRPSFGTELFSTSSQESQLQSAEMSCLRAPAYCLITQPSNSTSQSIYPPEPPCPQGPCCSLTVGYIPCIQQKAQVSGKNRSPSKTSGWRYL